MTFDVLNTQSFYSYIFGVDQTEAISINFSSSGYASLLIVNNLGSLFVFLVLDFVAGFTGLAILKINKLPLKWQKVLETRVNNFFFNGILSFLDQNYTTLMMSSLIHLSSINFDDAIWLYSFQNLFAFFMMIVLISMPISLVVLTQIYYRELKDRDSKASKKWGEKIQKLRMKRKQ